MAHSKSLLPLILAFFAIMLIFPSRQYSQPAGAEKLSISPPVFYKNLAVYLISGGDKFVGDNLLTLNEAMKKKLVKVHETGDVNELEIENLSPKIEIYIQSGDIVKGGKQDRLIADDFILPPKKKLPVSSYCVEHGRWQKRGGESAAEFSSSENNVPDRDLKIAVRKERSQQSVWSKVESYQDKVGRNNAINVKSANSPSSLQLSLESKELKGRMDDYLAKFKNIIDGKNNLIGYVFAINGDIVSGDVYCSNKLFARMWEKNLNSMVQEALSEGTKASMTINPTEQAILEFLGSAEKAEAKPLKLDERTTLITKEGTKSISFETIDQKLGKTCIRKNIINTQKK